MVESMHFAWFCHLQAAAYNSNIIDYLWNAVWMYAFTKSRRFTENRACVAIGGETSDKDILTLRCMTGPKNRRTGYCHDRSVNQQLINSWLQEVISLLNDITKKAKFKIFLEVGRKRQILTVLHSIKEKPDVDYGIGGGSRIIGSLLFIIPFIFFWVIHYFLFSFVRYSLFRFQFVEYFFIPSA